MKTKLALLLVVASTLLALPSRAQVCVKFGPPPAVGTLYGTPAGHVSGDLAFSQGGIDVYVYNFAQLPFGFAFNRAYIDVAPISLPGQSLRTNNINMLFDFRNIGFTVKKVTLTYLDLGGYENLAINGSGIYRGELSAAPATIGSGSVSVTSSPTPPPISGKTGTVTITGPYIRTFLIGGQELWIDNVCAQ